MPADGSGQPTLNRIRQAVSDDPDVAFVSPAQRSPSGDAAVLNVIPKSSPQDERTSELVDRLRDDVLPAATRASQVDVYVGGATATLQDLADKIAGRLPIFIAMVVGLSVLLLTAVFRSLWVPLVSAAFNLLSIAAAYGVVVLVFQDGVGASLLGVDGEAHEQDLWPPRRGRRVPVTVSQPRPGPRGRRRVGGAGGCRSAGLALVHRSRRDSAQEGGGGRARRSQAHVGRAVATGIRARTVVPASGGLASVR